MKRIVLFVVLCWAAASYGAVVAHYSFDADVQDVSGNGNGGTLVDVGTTGNSGVTTNAGAWRFGSGALHLDAERDYVSVTSRTFASGSPYSICFWARKASSTAQWNMAVGQRDTTGFFIALGNGGSTPGVRWRSSDGTTARQTDLTGTNWVEALPASAGTGADAARAVTNTAGSSHLRVRAWWP